MSDKTVAIKENRHQFDLNTGWAYWRNHLERGKGKMVQYLWNRVQWNYLHKFNFVPSFPLNVHIESSSECNIKCDHCFRQYMDMKEDEHMPMDMYRKIIDECAKYNLYTLKFSMRGEPTLNPEITEMVAYAKEKGIKEVWINTHGGNLTGEMMEGFVKGGLDILNISFDGLGEMYESIRKPLKYDKSLEKLKIVREVRDKLNSTKPLLKVQSLWSSIKHDPDEYLNIMSEIVDKVAYNIDYDFKEQHFVPDPEYVCYRLWQQLSITSKGDFLKCPSDFEKEEVLGNVMNMSIKTAWDTMQRKEREQHLARKRLDSDVCAKCHHGAKVFKVEKQLGDQNRNVNDIEYKGGFEGAGLHRDEKIPASWPSVKS
jgi:radical SAM protein with 4Fe4S-binding SPASM domain